MTVKARKFRLNTSAPENVTILVRVFGMDTQIGANMFVDIWDFYMKGQLQVTAKDGFSCRMGQ